MKLFELIGKSIAGKVATVVVVILVIGGGVLTADYFIPSWGLKTFIKKSLKIDETTNVVEQIKTISEFTTACYYEEFVLTKVRNDAPNQYVTKVTNKMRIKVDSIRNEIAIICKASIRAGYDLSEMTENELKVSKDTISITLPAPKVFDIIMNPSDYDIFVEEGTWSHEEITEIQTNAQKKVLDNAVNTGLLKKANEVGKVRIEELFKTFGFNVVNVILKEN